MITTLFHIDVKGRGHRVYYCGVWRLYIDLDDLRFNIRFHHKIYVTQTTLRDPEFDAIVTNSPLPHPVIDWLLKNVKDVEFLKALEEISVLPI